MARTPRRFVRVDVTGVIQGFSNVGRAVDRANEALQIELAEAGRDEMQRLIETRGTGETWTRSMPAKIKPLTGSLRDGSSPGRVNTGRMRDSVRVKFEGQGNRKIATFGWVDAPSDDEKYFRAQEYGMTPGTPQGFRKSIDIPGMFALRDARRHVVNSVLPKLIRKYERMIASGRTP